MREIKFWGKWNSGGKMKIKNCPFCKGNDYTVEYKENSCMVGCDNCGAYGPPADYRVGISDAEAKKEAIKLWNKRKGGGQAQPWETLG